ncbi:hypothetical protein NDU88_005034 [Pleurodeles waltl]|uniref:Uncharacterized protein n=1 Tax=Pleurodeles waltl TaxID=8319 RepID=A0AAV7W9L7_PLEWA|nr:hypothetical protein NDU88_005034 [Pleurodeles waltl]
MLPGLATETTSAGEIEVGPPQDMLALPQDKLDFAFQAIRDMKVTLEYNIETAVAVLGPLHVDQCKLAEQIMAMEITVQELFQVTGDLKDQLAGDWAGSGIWSPEQKTQMGHPQE